MIFGVCASRVLIAVSLVLLVAPAALGSVQSELAFHRGVAAYGDDRLDEAKQQFEKVLAEDAEDTAALSYLGLIALKQKDPNAAIDYFDRALAVDPDNAENQLDRGIALMDAGRLDEARQAFARAQELAPDDARAELFSGIAAYRAGDHAGAKPHFDRAAELDPSLRDEAHYYTGLSDAFLGNLEAASASFVAAAEQSPLSPLAMSATNFQQQLRTAGEEDRPWRFQVTGGMEYDSNPLILGDSVQLVPVPNDEPDGRGVIRMRGDYTFLAGDWGSLTAGYDSYYSFHINDTIVNLQTQNPWIAGGYNIGPVRLGLRYDFAYTFIDTSDSFRMLNRVSPSIAINQSDWGVSYLYYQYYAEDFYNDPVTPKVFDLTGHRNVAGFNQFFFLPKPPFSYVRLGVAGEWLRTEGSEWSNNGVEALVGAGYDFDYEIAFSWLYRFAYRDFQNRSAQTPLPDTKFRNDYRHSLTLDLSKTINDHWQVSLGAALTWNESNVAFYEYDRQVGGAYVTYHF